ncbi:hypothetical protein BVC80_1101g40 [Macleaya cordata]|uniref:ABI family n=1 Tax=Macleaya cordata TaxID=56857 RepID=A0A200QCR0_MACCD|nr:hypothetical protein BVC80_1101g40 [Macleaya cordata]
MMKTSMSSSSSMSVSYQSSNYDELFMNQSLLFSDSLKDLKNLRSQLYSAAEYFEVSYTNDNQKQIMVNNLKDYTIKALVNTVDHLGSITHKVNGLVDEKVDEVSAAELRFSCIEQRLRTCQAFIDHEGRTQQSLVIKTPKHHKRYIMPGKCAFPFGEHAHASGHTIPKYQGFRLEDEDNWKKLKNALRTTMRNTQPSLVRKERSPSPTRTKSKYQGRTPEDEDNWKKLKNAVRGTIRNAPPSSIRKARSPSPTQGRSQEDEDNWKKLKNAVRGKSRNSSPSSVRKARSPSPTPRPSLQPGLFSFREKQRVSDKRSDSPRSKFPLLRSGSLSIRSTKTLSRSTTPIPSRPITPSRSTRNLSRSTTPIPSRPTTPIPSNNARKRYPSEPRKSMSMRINADKDNQKDIEQQPSKSKRILKALLSRRKSKKDDVLYTFLDEY